MQKFIIIPWLLALLTLSACTRQTAENPPQTTALATMTTTSTEAIVATATGVPAAQAQPSATAVVNLDTQTGLTPEGYHMLGDANAPVTFVDYSDFF